MVHEGRKVRENIAKRRNSNFGQTSKKSRSESFPQGTSLASSFRSLPSQSSGQQSSIPSYSGQTTRSAEASPQCQRYHMAI